MSNAMVVVLMAVLLILSFLACRYYGPGNVGVKNSARRVQYYVALMHPAYKSEKPGIAPDCAVQLEPVYEHVLSNNPSRLHVRTHSAA